jgi:hypothetical protein
MIVEQFIIKDVEIRNHNFAEPEALKTLVMKLSLFCSLLEVNRRFEVIYRLHLQGRRISRAGNQREIKWQAESLAFLPYCSKLKMEVTCFSETSVNFQRFTQPYIAEDRIILS